jgi:predicted alpha/beta hydrolase family esterase
LWLGIAPLLLVASGCAPYTVVDYAAKHDMTVRYLEGDAFGHLIIERVPALPAGELHIYIEGDGIPWVGSLPSADPTPHDTLALRLMNADPNDTVYVGRPCYFDMDRDSGRCHPKYWTSHRYREEVVRSMVAVIAQVRSPEHEKIVFIGHSGGGVLAVLLESEIDGVVGVISVAANLDIDAWTEHHDYDRLEGSMNPMTQTRDAAIPHLQYVGGKDDIVPPQTASAYARLQPGVELIEIHEFGHACCWERAWPEILEFASGEFAE